MRNSTLSSWLGVMRLWSLTASTIPVLVGAALAARDGRFAWLILALTLVCGWLLQIATNLLNTYGDYRSGVDTLATLPTAPQLVTGALRPLAVRRAGALALALAAGLGAAITVMSDWRLLFFAAAGVAGAGGYTTGARYKYAGLGVPAVFFLMGVLMVGASYFAQTGALSWTPLIASLPVSCLVAAILHGNDLRDTVTDRAASIQTTTLIVGDRAAQTLFYALHLAPYLVVVTSVAVGALPAWSLLTLLASPLTFGAITACAGGFRAHDAVRIGKLEGLSAGTHFIFGALLVLGLVLAHLL
jgi:1,4-dihydroxy-2-naphthoate octaprenyltransferase